MALAFVLARRRGLVVALGLTLLLAVAVFVGEQGVRDALRGTGWNGA